MKWLLIIALMLIGMISMGQTVIIGDSIMGGVPIPFADTILSVDCDGDGESYYIDLNEDEIDNIRVFLDCYMGGTGTKAYIGFQAFDNFYLQVDTNFITTFQNWDEETDSIITWEDKYTIPKPSHGFYIERKVTEKGIISTKHYLQ